MQWNYFFFWWLIVWTNRRCLDRIFTRSSIDEYHSNRAWKNGCLRSHSLWHQKILQTLCWWHTTTHKTLDIPTVWAKLNEFDKNLKLMEDTFPDGVIHFLGIKVSVDGTDVYRKDTHAGHYTYFPSFEPFSRRTAWIKSFFYCAFKICSTKKLFENHISTIKSLMSWNGYPNSIKKLFN